MNLPQDVSDNLGTLISSLDTRLSGIVTARAEAEAARIAAEVEAARIAAEAEVEAARIAAEAEAAAEATEAAGTKMKAITDGGSNR